MKRLITTMLFLVLGCTGLSVAATGCEDAASQYAELNRTIVIEPNDDATAANYQRIRDSVTEQLHQLIDDQLVQELAASSFPQVSNIVSRVKCVQQVLPQYSRTSTVTNVPTAMLLNGKEPRVVVSFQIYRGGVGAPDLLPFVEVFRRDGAGWHVVGTTGSEYAGSTFHLQQLARKYGEHWFLIWGHALGAAGAGSRFTVIAFDGTEFHTVWQDTLPPGVIVQEVTPDHLIVTGETTDERGHAYEYRSRYDVVPEGLKRGSKVVTKNF